MPQLFKSSGQTGSPDQDSINQKKKMAQMLQMMAIQPDANAANKPAIVNVAATIMKGLGAWRMDRKANKEQEALNASRMQDWENIRKAAQGTPEQRTQVPVATGLPTVDDEGNQMPSIPTKEQVTPAVPGSREQIVQAMLQARDPQLRMAGANQLLQPPQARWEQVQGPRGSLLQRNTVSGEMKPVVGTDSLKDWQMPGYVETQRKIAEAKGERMTPTVQKEIIESEETAQASKNVIGMLNEAMQLNNKAYSGPAAKERAIGMSWLPGNNEAADATVQLDNIMTGQALESLKATFGGMPTEGERKILLEMQAAPSKTPKQREDIMRRAIAAAESRAKFNREKAESLRSGTYFKPGQQGQTAPASNIDDLLKKY